MTAHPSIRRAAPVLGFLAVSALLVWRALHGLDWTDESYYATEALRIARGDLMFKCDWSPHQVAAMVYSPLIWAYIHLTGGTTGILLFLRLCYFAASMCVAVLFYRAAKPLSGGTWAFLATMPVLFCVAPVTFSYNSVMMLGLFAACAFLLGARNSKGARKRTTWLVLAGIAAGTAFVAYPTSLLTLPLLCAWTAFDPGLGEGTHVKARNLALLATGCATCLLFVAAFLVLQGSFSYVFSDWRNLVSGSRGDPATHSPLGYLGSVVSLYGKLNSAALLALGALAFASRRTSRKELGRMLQLVTLCGLALLLALQCLPALFDLGTKQTQIRLYLVLSSAAPVLFLLNGCRWNSSLWMALLGIVASFAVYWVTQSGPSFYMYPHALSASAAVLYLGSERTTILPERVHQTALVFAAVLFAVAAASCSWYVYRDAPLPQLDKWIENGPGAGLFTTEERATQYQELTEAIGKTMPQEGNVLFAPVLPFGYLCTDALPAAPATWAGSFENLAVLARYSAYYNENPEKLPAAICVPDAVFDDRNSTEGIDAFILETMGDRNFTVVETELATFYLFDNANENGT